MDSIRVRAIHFIALDVTIGILSRQGVRGNFDVLAIASAEVYVATLFEEALDDGATNAFGSTYRIY